MSRGRAQSVIMSTNINFIVDLLSPYNYDGAQFVYSKDLTISLQVWSNRPVHITVI